MKGKRVLVIDDHKATVSTLTKFLEDAGATVESAASYDEGIAALKKNPPDAAIVDLMLPNRSGLDLVKEARDSAPDTFFAILTNTINPDSVADAMDANVTLFLQKADHDPAEIVQMIASKLRARPEVS